jgi:hypothetical protein
MDAAIIQGLTKISETLFQGLYAIANAISGRPYPPNTGEDIVTGAVIIALSILAGFIAHAFIVRKEVLKTKE